jgi:hypothetical protein
MGKTKGIQATIPKQAAANNLNNDVIVSVKNSSLSSSP